MPLSITTQANVALTAGQSVEVAPALVGRVATLLQVQAEGFSWYKLDAAAAAKDDGIRLGGWKEVQISSVLPGPQGLSEFYEGPIQVFWEGGGVDPATNEPVTTANCRVIVVTVV